MPKNIHQIAFTIPLPLQISLWFLPSLLPPAVSPHVEKGCQDGLGGSEGWFYAETRLLACLHNQAFASWPRSLQGEQPLNWYEMLTHVFHQSRFPFCFFFFNSWSVDCAVAFHFVKSDLSLILVCKEITAIERFNVVYLLLQNPWFRTTEAQRTRFVVMSRGATIQSMIYLDLSQPCLSALVHAADVENLFGIKLFSIQI